MVIHKTNEGLNHETRMCGGFAQIREKLTPSPLSALAPGLKVIHTNFNQIF